MGKVVVNADGSGNLVSQGSAGSTVVQTQTQNPDHSNVKDTRK